MGPGVVVCDPRCEANLEGWTRAEERQAIKDEQKAREKA